MEKEEDKIELRSEEFQEVLGAVPHWILRWGIVTILVILVIILIGSAIFKYPDTISSTVTLTGTTPPAHIVAKASGKLQEVLTEDNKSVKAGEYLAIIENPAKTNDIIFLKKYLNQLNQNHDTIMPMPPRKMSLGNLQSTYSSFYMTLFDYTEFKRLAYYSKKVEIMKDRIKRNENHYNNVYRQKDIIEDQLLLTKKQYSRDSLLNKKGVLSIEEFEKVHNQYLQGLLSIENINTNLENMQIQIAQMKESLLDAEYQYIEKENNLRTQLNSQITQLITDIQTWEINYVLMAPIDGKITFSNYWTENQNVTGGEEIFSVIPDDSGNLIGKVSLPIARSGKVQVGQKVNIRFDNFPDNEFGTIRGHVNNISLVPLKEQEANCYTLEISLPKGLTTTYNKELPYLPEMTGQADIITDDISLLQRFFMPMRKLWNESFN